jgi:hypothetical protein
MKRAVLTIAATVSVLVAAAVGVTALATPASGITTTPVVNQVSPAHGPVGGGTLVNVEGAHLLGATAVTFGGVSAAFVNRSDSMLQAFSPAGTANTSVDIEVTTAFGTSTATSRDLFTYVTTPAIQSIRPNVGSTRGGNLVAISGSDFTGVTGASAVMFGSLPAQSYTVLSPTSIAAISPAAGLSIVDVKVTGTDGTTPTDPADRYSYALRVPVVTSVVFDVGPVIGGTNVTITGSRFAKDATVNFGTTPATNVTYVNSTTLTATVPAAGGPGIVDVTVATSKGASVINHPIDEYRYTDTLP